MDQSFLVHSTALRRQHGTQRRRTLHCVCAKTGVHGFLSKRRSGSEDDWCCGTQVYEVSNELVEVREEAELLRLQMEVAQQEEEAAKGALAAAQAALATALAAPDESTSPEAHQVHKPPGSA